VLRPTGSLGMPRPGGTEKSRRRKLDDREIRIFWKKLTRSRLNVEVRIALKLILVTAQRPGEVALAARSEFDLERRIWTIPAERSKNGQQHEVPLSDLAPTLIRHQAAVWRDAVLDPLPMLASPRRCAHHSTSVEPGYS
jgi:integrase